MTAIGDLIAGRNVEVSFGRGAERGVPKMRIYVRQGPDTITSITEFRLSREDAERLHREIGVVLSESN